MDEVDYIEALIESEALERIDSGIRVQYFESIEQELPSWEGTLADWREDLARNGDHTLDEGSEEVAKVRALKEGESIVLGGGARGQFAVKRVPFVKRARDLEVKTTKIRILE